ncbi:hypothetical protein BJF83_22540 [Nocardiopsis sp. CNR-923]|nr:hypothetical protein BJF83_22540 [Nocardiopsis sp. CNR-923]
MVMSMVVEKITLAATRSRNFTALSCSSGSRLFSQPALPKWSHLVNPLYASALFVARWICSRSVGSDK